MKLTMRYTYPFFTVLVLLLVLASCGGTKILFEKDGPDWIKGGDASWQFTPQEIIGTSAGGAGFIMTKESYQDFELELDFYPDETVNSGVFVRCKDYDISNVDCYELNIWDLNPNQTYRTGGVVTRASPVVKVETLHQWNTYKIKNVGNRLQVWVNGILTASILNNDLAEGYIGLQAAETGTIKFRNVRVKKF